jgi:hypothetical protein
VRIANAATTFILVLFLAIAAVAGGIGFHSLAHLTKARDLLAHDPACSGAPSLTTPASENAPCAVVHGTIQSTDVDEVGSNTGAHYHYYVTFAPLGSGKTVYAFVGDDIDSDQLDAFHSTEHKPGARAVAKYVDGEINYIVDEFGTFGPAFDPTATFLGWALIALGVFFAVLGVAIFARSLLTSSVLAGAPKKR